MPEEVNDQSSEKPSQPVDRPFKRLSAEETKAICEQVVIAMKTIKRVEEQNRQKYREMYGKEMPDKPETEPEEMQLTPTITMDDQRSLKMTLTDYMNPEKFPTTSQKGLSPQRQLFLDAFNYDQMEEAIAGGATPNETQKLARVELQAKRPWMEELTKQIATGMIDDEMPKEPEPEEMELTPTITMDDQRSLKMTLTDYMNPEKFPMTSRKAYSPKEQLFLDAFNYDQLEEAITRGHQMDEEQVLIRAELQAKRPWMEELTKQIAAGMIDDEMPEMGPPHIVSTDIDDAQVLVADAEEEDFEKLLGNAIMAISNDKTLSNTEKRSKLLGALKLMDEEEEEDFEKQLGNAIMSIINDAGLSNAEKRKRIVGALNLREEDDMA